MFKDSPSIRFTEFEKYRIDGNKRGKLEKAFFSFFYVMLEDYYSQQNNKYRLYMKPDDQLGLEDFFNPIHTLHLSPIRNLIAAYLAIFYHYYYLIEDYKRHFENFSFYDYNSSQSDLMLFISRYEYLVHQNLTAYKQTNIHNNFVVADNFNFNNESNNPDVTAINRISTGEYLSGSEFADLWTDLISDEISKDSKIDTFIIGAFKLMIQSSKAHHIQSSLQQIDTEHSITTTKLAKLFQSFDNRNEGPEDKKPLKIPVFKRDFWDIVLKNVSELMIQEYLLLSMNQKFKYTNTYRDKYYCESHKDLVNRFSTIIQSTHGSISKNHLKKVLVSRSSLTLHSSTYKEYVSHEQKVLNALN